MTSADAKTLTKKQRAGRAILVALIASSLAISLGIITLYVSMRGFEHLPIRVGRFAFTSLLLLWLYRGSNVARGICIVLFGFSGFMATEAGMNGGEELTTIALMGGMGLFYLTFAVVLISSPSVSEFLAYQRESLPQKSKFERHRVGKVFAWQKNTVLKPHDRLTLVIPARMLDALNCDSSAEISAPENEDKIYVRLDVGVKAWMSESSQAYVLPWCDGEKAAKLIQLTLIPQSVA